MDNVRTLITCKDCLRFRKLYKTSKYKCLSCQQKSKDARKAKTSILLDVSAWKNEVLPWYARAIHKMSGIIHYFKL